MKWIGGAVLANFNIPGSAKMFAKWIVGTCLLLAVGCRPCPFCADAPPEDRAMVVLQITETEDAAALERMVAELRTRGAKAAILVDGGFAAEHGEQLRALRAEGHEILAFIRPATGTLSQLTRAAQEQLITETKTALEACLGAPVTGFRATRFDHNADTWAILDALGFEYDLAFVAGRSCLPGYEAEVLPYRSPDHRFWAVPMHARDNEGRLSAFCDNPFDNLPAEQWAALLRSEFDRLRADGRPLLVEFHPDFSGTDEGRFQAFVDFLDHAVANDAQFMSVTEYVSWSETARATCDE